MPSIKKLHARQILDSRGNPTLEVDCELDDGSFGRAAVPSGASTGSREAKELRDKDQSLFGGKSVYSAIQNIETEIAAALNGMDALSQKDIDLKLIELDGTKQKERLGANAILGVSMATCVARSQSENQSLFISLAKQYECERPKELPVPQMNILNGGRHADNSFSFQECMIVPTKFSSFSEGLQAGVEVYHTLKQLLKEKGYQTNVGDEGGFAPPIKNLEEAFTLLMKAIGLAGYEGKIQLAIDAAASEFFSEETYTLNDMALSSKQLTELYENLCNNFPIVSIEDSHSEDDWDGFAELTRRISASVQVVGDDLLVTNTEYIQKAIEQNTCNAVLIKLNQIGTVTEAAEAIQLAQSNNLHTVVSHRSGETEDTFIAHLAVAFSTGQIKTGAPCRGERTCKYNELLRIEEELGDKAVYATPFKTTSSTKSTKA